MQAQKILTPHLTLALITVTTVPTEDGISAQSSTRLTSSLQLGRNTRTEVEITSHQATENTSATNKQWDDTGLLALGAHILGDNSFVFHVVILIKEA